MNPIQKYHVRYQAIKSEKDITSEETRLQELLQNDVSGLNNFFMAALGMSTLMLRLGAVIQVCRKFEKLDEQGDLLFSRQLLDNLKEIMPSDSNWKKLWEVSAEATVWKAPSLKLGGNESVLSRFVTFRNRFVHQQIQLSIDCLPQIAKAIILFEEMERLYSLFEKGELIFKNGQYYWIDQNGEVNLHPYLQVGTDENQPYIFQGIANREKVHLLNTQLGDKIDQAAEVHLNPLFEPLQESLRNGAGQLFDHSSRIATYQGCFVGRERERALLLDFCSSKNEQNVLTVKSPAGMGKGALMADLIEQLKTNNIQTLYHFCGAGLHNNLHAILYHLILQGKKNVKFDGAQFWTTKEEDVKRKLDRLPSKYTDTIHLFQHLLDECVKFSSNNKVGNLVVIIDALDEAQVASTQLKISDWFYTYNEKEEPEEDWRSASNIRWVFTYRCAEDGSENFYKFPHIKQLATIEELQPLKGLSPEAAFDAFREYNVSEDFMEVLIEKATIA
ncbi:MAG: ATPase domain [Bacteroidota bacterium]|jgi:hypothetical protein